MPKQQAHHYTRSVRLQSCDYTRVFEKARALRQSNVVVLVKENQGTTARLGMIVPKKAVKLAVNRNWIKRYVRERFRLTRLNLPAVDLVVLIKAQLPFDKQRLTQQIDKLWLKINLA